MVPGHGRLPRRTAVAPCTPWMMRVEANTAAGAVASQTALKRPSLVGNASAKVVLNLELHPASYLSPAPMTNCLCRPANSSSVVPRVVPRTAENRSYPDLVRPVFELNAFGETASVQVIPHEGFAGMRT